LAAAVTFHNAAEGRALVEVPGRIWYCFGGVARQLLTGNWRLWGRICRL